MTLSAEGTDPSKMSRPGPRRRWSEEEKRRIVAEAEAPGASMSVVARRHDLNANLLFTWRRQFREGERGAGAGSAAFVPAVIEPAESAETAEPAATAGEDGRAIEERSAARPPGLIEIVLASGHRVIVDKGVSAAALGRVIGALERR